MAYPSASLASQTRVPATPTNTGKRVWLGVAEEQHSTVSVDEGNRTLTSTHDG